jgi:hypothetical protein
LLGQVGCVARSEVADTNAAVRIEAEDFVEGKNAGGRSRDDSAADDGHLTPVNIAATDGKAAADNTGDAEDAIASVASRSQTRIKT